MSEQKAIDLGSPLAGEAAKYDTGRCDKSGVVLSEKELRAARTTFRIHGFAYWCGACFDAWGDATFGWQAGARRVLS
mgnify:CR=1 FL=1